MTVQSSWEGGNVVGFVFFLFILKNSSFTELSHHPKLVVPHETHANKHAYGTLFVIPPVLLIPLLYTNSVLGTILRILCYNQSLLLDVCPVCITRLAKSLLTNEGGFFFE